MSLPAPAVQESANEILRLLQTSKVTTQQLKEAATRYGLPLSRVNRLPIRSLQHLVSVGAAIGCLLCFLSQQQPSHTTMQHLFHLHRAL